MICGWKLERDNLKRSERKVIELTPYTTWLFGNKETGTKESDPRQDLYFAFEHVRRVYTLAVCATEKMIREYGVSIELLERRVRAQEVAQETARRAADGTGAGPAAGPAVTQDAEPARPAVALVEKRDPDTFGLATVVSEDDSDWETSGERDVSDAVMRGAKRGARPAGGTRMDLIDDVFSGPGFDVLPAADLVGAGAARNRTKREAAEMKISTGRQAAERKGDRRKGGNAGPSRKQLLDRKAMLDSDKRRNAIVAQREQVAAAEREAAERLAAEREAAAEKEAAAEERLTKRQDSEVIRELLGQKESYMARLKGILGVHNAASLFRTIDSGLSEFYGSDCKNLYKYLCNDRVADVINRIVGNDRKLSIVRAEIYKRVFEEVNINSSPNKNNYSVALAELRKIMEESAKLELQ